MKKFDVSAQAQRQRLLKRLQEKPCTTIEARAELDILNPAARINELRQQGYNIQTHWTYVITPAAVKHRVGKYVLFTEKYSKEKKYA
ncbi:MAG: helix-turn-helix domain-containing protein [Gammaproteobacteria bacterium]